MKIDVRPPVAVAKRDLLWSGGVVQLKVPANARTLSAPNPEGGAICYLQFPQVVKGGMVNIHVHTERPDDYVGKKVTAKTEVFVKEHQDGRRFVYIDLKPVADDTEPTHRLAVMQMVPGVTRFADGALVFETPAPLQGAVVIVGHDQKFS
ncbi:hypothetical protein EXS62_01615 [Candidatus Kaiserbacteria bacterium]|nr:hypothetical protein [Candidatus Kaiserbacteria bacterium]